MPSITLHSAAQMLNASAQSGSAAAASSLVDGIGLLESSTLEEIARFRASWPNLVPQLLNISRDAAAGPDALTLARLALRLLGICLRVRCTPEDLRSLLQLLHPAGAHGVAHLHGAILGAIESAVKGRAVRRSGAACWWSLPAFASAASPRTQAARADMPTPPVSRTSYLAPTWTSWPFSREFSLWTLVRVSAFGAGQGEDRSTVLRVVAGNGSRLHIWLSPGAVHVEVFEPPASPTAQPISASSSFSLPSPLAAAHGLLGAAAKNVFALGQAAQATVAAKLSGAAPPSPGSYASGPSAEGISHCVATSAAIREGAWISLHIHHAHRKGLLGGGSHTLSVFVDSVCVLTTSDVPYPQTLSSAPLALARFAEGLNGEMGPIYLFQEGVSPVPPRTQADLVLAHTGDAAPSTVVPIHVAAAAAQSAEDTDSPLAHVAAMFHPAHALAVYESCTGPTDSSTGDTLDCICTDVLGASGWLLQGYNGAAPVVATSIRDAIGSLGGISVLLPLFGSSLQRALKRARAEADHHALTSQHAPGAATTGGSATPPSVSEIEADARLAAEISTYCPPEPRSVVAQVIDILALFLRDHPTNAAVALRTSLLHMLRLELAPQLRWRHHAKAGRQQFDMGSPVSVAASPRPPPLLRVDSAGLQGGLRGHRCPAHSDPALVPALLSLAHACAISGDLKAECWRTLLCWFPLFAHTQPEIQATLFTQVTQLVRARPDFYRSSVGFAGLCDAVLLWYTMLCTDPVDSLSVSADDLLLGRPAARGAAARRAAADAAAGKKLASGRLMPEQQRHALVRQAVALLGCAMHASSLVVQGEGASTVGGAASTRAAALRQAHLQPAISGLQAVDTIQPLKKSDAEALIGMLTAPLTGVAGEDRDLLRAEVVSLITGCIDHDASRVSGADAAELAAAAATLAANQRRAESSSSSGAGGGAGGSDADAAAGMADALLASGSFNALPVLDAASGSGDYSSFLLFAVLPSAETDVLKAAAVRGVLHAQRASMTRPSKLGEALRDMAGGIGKSILRVAAERDVVTSALANVASLAANATSSSTVGGRQTGTTSSGSGGAGSSDGSVGGYAGSAWARAFNKLHGFDLIYYAIKQTPGGVTPLVYAALVDGLFLPDSVELLLRAETDGPLAPDDGGSGSGSSTPASGQPGEAARLAAQLRVKSDSGLTADARALSLSAAVEYAACRSTGSTQWCRDVTSARYELPERAPVSAPVVIQLLLRLLPQMPGDVALRCLVDLYAHVSASEVSRKLCLRQVLAWDALLLRTLSDRLPTAYPARAEMAKLDTVVTSRLAASSAAVAATTCAAIDAAAPAAVAAPGGEASSTTDALYAAGERLFMLLLRSAMDSKDGWISFQRLFAMTPLLLQHGPAPTALSSWSLSPACLSAPALHGHRLLTWLVVFIVDDFDYRRTRSITSAHLDNLLHVTAVLERELVGPGLRTGGWNALQLADRPMREDGGELTPACTGAPDERMDILMASHLVALWDRLLMPSPDKAEVFMSRSAAGLPLAGNLRTLLLSISLWLMQTLPVDHPESLRACARLDRLLKPLLVDVAPTRSASAAAAATGNAGGSSEGGAGGATPSAAGGAGRAGADGKGEGEDWEDVKAVGRPGVTAEQWLLFTYWMLNEYLRRLREEVVAALGDETASHEAKVSRLQAASASADLCVVLLMSLFTQAPHGADVAHTAVNRLQSFLEGYQLYKALRASKAGADAAETSSAAQQLRDEWRWLLDDVTVDSSTASDGGTAEARKPDHDHSSAWVRQPGWTSVVPSAVDAVQAAHGVAWADVDERLQRPWAAILVTIHLDAALLAPLQPNAAIQQQIVQAGAASVGSFGATQVEDAAGEDEEEEDSADRARGGRALALTVATNVASTAKFGFNKIRSGIKKGIAGIQALSAALDAESEAEAYLAALEGRVVTSGGGAGGKGGKGGAADTKRAALSPMLTAFSRNALPTEEHEFVPSWFRAEWVNAQMRARTGWQKSQQADGSRRLAELLRRQDMLMTVHRAYVRLLKALQRERAPWYAGYPALSALPQRMSKVEDGLRRRMRWKHNRKAVDYSKAAYKLMLSGKKAGTAGGALASPGYKASTSAAPTAAPAAAAVADASAIDAAAAPPAAPAAIEAPAVVAAEETGAGAGAGAGADRGSSSPFADADATLPPGLTSLDDAEALLQLLSTVPKFNPAVEHTPRDSVAEEAGIGTSAAAAATAKPVPAPAVATDDRTASSSDGAEDTAAAPASTSEPTAHPSVAVMPLHGSAALSIALPSTAERGRAALVPSASETSEYSCRCAWVTIHRTAKGLFRLTNTHIYFEPTGADTQARGGTAAATAGGSNGGYGGEGDADEDEYDVVHEEAGDTGASVSGGATGGASGAAALVSPSVASTTGSEAPRPNRVDRVLPPLHPQRWALALLTRVLPRRYMLQMCALELFFADGLTVFLAFQRGGGDKADEKLLREIVERVWAQAPPRLSGPKAWSFAQLREAINAAQETWVQRQCSNFEYLMELNTLCRSFNDLTQYPVFPWVIADYTSSRLDLDAPTTYRDLTKPIGALNQRRLDNFRERMEGMQSSGGSLADGAVPPFLYGSHYSSAGIVLFFLIRMEPFTALAVELQNGRFDCADRLFFSIIECWKGVNNSMSDVKELIPEWFTSPQMLLNAQHLPLGTLQDGEGVVDDVILPPWASSAEEFVHMQRTALESEYVSSHLHRWVDLIFGFQQRGPAAVEADNLFYYLTYEDGVDLAAIRDPVIRTAMEAQIANFGQTPSQLFTKPHPARIPRADALQAHPLFAFTAPLRMLTPGSLASVGRALAMPAASTPAAATAAAQPVRLPQLLTDVAAAPLSVYTAAVHPSNTSHTAVVAAARANADSSADGSSTAASRRLAPQLAGAKLFMLSSTNSATGLDQSTLHLNTLLAGKLLTVYGGVAWSLHRFLPSFVADGLPFDLKLEKPKLVPYADIGLARWCQRGALSSGAGVATARLAVAHTDSWSPSPFATESVTSLLNSYSTRCGPPLNAANTIATLLTPDVAGTRDAANAESVLIFTAANADGVLRWHRVGLRKGSDSLSHGKLPECTVVSADAAGAQQVLATGHTDGRVCVWQLTENTPAAIIRACNLAVDPIGAHNRSHFPSSATVFVSTGVNTDTALICTAECYTLHAPVTAVHISLMLRLVAAGCLDGSVVLFDAVNGKPLRVLDPVNTGLCAQLPPTAALLAPESLPLPVQHTILTANGDVVIHWSTGLLRNKLASSEDDSGGATAASPAALPLSFLGVANLNGETRAVVPLRPISGVPASSAHDVWLTSLTVSADGSAVIHGMSDGCIISRHGFTLEAGGWLRAHEEAAPTVTLPSPAAAAASASSAAMPVPAASLPAAASLLSKTPLGALAAKAASVAAAATKPPPATNAGASRASAGAGAAAIASGSSTGGGSVAVLGPTRRLPATAVTCLTLVEEDRYLLAGCADGRIVLVADHALALARAASSLQQGLFALV